MFEPTDASKCDERQVKKKDDSLTKKKRGETLIMSTQSMKTWKLVLFFVVSVMVMAGAFSNEVFAQEAKVRISPPRVQSDSVVSTVTVYYDLKGGGTTQSVDFELPTELTAAYDSNDTGSLQFYVIEAADEMSDIAAPSNTREKSYVTTWDDLRDKPADYAITVTSAGVVAFPSIAMVEDNRITVTYHNVKVAQLTRTQLEEGMISEATRSTYEKAFTVRDTAGDTADTDPNITLLHPILSDIRVTPHRVKEKSTRAVTVSYQVRNPMLTDNEVSIELPPDFERTGLLFDAILYPTRDSSGAILLRKPATDTIPYVTMTETVDADFDTPAAVDANGVFTVTGDMEL